jgi:hypothetical protein
VTISPSQAEFPAIDGVFHEVQDLHTLLSAGELSPEDAYDKAQSVGDGLDVQNGPEIGSTLLQLMPQIGAAVLARNVGESPIPEILPRRGFVSDIVGALAVAAGANHMRFTARFNGGPLVVEAGNGRLADTVAMHAGQHRTWAHRQNRQ